MAVIPTDDVRPTLAIIGGGWSGMAAAVRAAELGFAVTVFEAAPILGGRARRVEHGNTHVDNGQHILLGAYSETLALIEKLGVDNQAAWYRQTLRWVGTDSSPRQFQMQMPKLPIAPDKRLAVALLLASGLTLAEKWRTLRVLMAWRRAQFVFSDSDSVADICQALPKRIVTVFFEPLCLAALNTPIALASARIFGQVLRTALQSPDASDLILPRRDLSALMPDAAAAWLRTKGHQVLCKHSVQTLVRDHKAWALTTQNGVFQADAVLLAVAAQQANFLLRPILKIDPRIAQCCEQLSHFEFEAIATIYVQITVAPNTRLDTEAMIRLDDAPGQWLFNRQLTHCEPNRFALVISALPNTMPDGSAQSREALANDCQNQLRRLFPGITTISVVTVIIEKRATWQCRPNLSRPNAGIIGPRLGLCGDYTHPHFPATLEAATESGMLAAEVLWSAHDSAVK